MSDERPPVDDLFGDDDLAVEKKPRSPDPLDGGHAVGRRPSGRLIGIAVLLLVVVIGWWLSSRHHDRYYIVVRDNNVRVERGYYFPFGSGAWSPNRAYEPFKIPAGIAPEEAGPLTAEDLDRVLHRLYVTIAERELEDMSEGNADIAEDMLMRANKLQYTSVDEDRRLLEMLGDVAFRRGLTEVRGIQSRFDEALKQFRLAAQRGGVAYRGAQRWVDAIARLRDEFRRLSVESGLDPDKILATAKAPAGNPLLPIPLPPPVPAATPAPDAGVQ